MTVASPQFIGPGMLWMPERTGMSGKVEWTAEHPAEGAKEMQKAADIQKHIEYKCLA